MVDIYGLNYVWDYEVEVVVESVLGMEKIISLLCMYDCF